MGKIASVLRAVIGAGAPLRCVHCRRLRTPSTRYVAGPGIYICESCAADAARRLAEVPSPARAGTCSFCGARALAVELGSGHDHAICTQCVRLVSDILAAASQASPPT